MTYSFIDGFSHYNGIILSTSDNIGIVDQLGEVDDLVGHVSLIVCVILYTGMVDVLPIGPIARLLHLMNTVNIVD